jgi:hypothetical protein
MFIRFSSLNALLLLALLSIPVGTAFASQPSQMEPAVDGANHATPERHVLSTAKGLIMLDYEVIPVFGNSSIDLLGVHYLHQMNNWLYLGFGAHAPLVYGNYGGFMALDVTIHAQHRIYGNLFADAGVSLGGAAGGSSLQRVTALSGTGGFIKGYVGLGYDFSGFSAGVNFARAQLTDSPINHAQLNLFIQKPVSFSLGSYADAGSTTASDFSPPGDQENILTLELNNIFQIKPKGSNKNTINSLSLQFSHFLTNHEYLFFEAAVGYKGLPIYNEVLGGAGYRLSISPHVNLYSQVGVGSGGYVPSFIDTGPGLLVYPKVSLEYLLDSNIGLSVTGGYLAAPKGSSRNYTLGAAMNYHLSTGNEGLPGSNAARNLVLRGFRFSMFQQTEFDVRISNRKRNNNDLLSFQLDKIVNDHWYVPIQLSLSYNRFLGYPGYGEILTGLGIQNKFSATNRFQGFFQILIGANVLGMILKPSIGLNYTLSDSLALYGQLGRATSLDKLNLYRKDLPFSSYFAGAGLTYRFSLPDTLAR